jgi:hypothetical protein
MKHHGCCDARPLYSLDLPVFATEIVRCTKTPPKWRKDARAADLADPAFGAPSAGQTNPMRIKNRQSKICKKWTVSLFFLIVVCDGCA